MTGFLQNINNARSLSVRHLFYSILWLFAAHTLFANALQAPQHTQMQRVLAADGFENVIARSNDSFTLLVFEDSRYRYSAKGVMRAVIGTSPDLPLSTAHSFYIIKKYGVPLFALESNSFTPMTSRANNRRILLPQPKPSHRSAALIALSRRFDSQNPSHFKSDLVIHPDIRMSLGDYANPIAAQVNIMPELRTQLFNGLVLSASIILPLYNELETWGDYVRLGPTSLNYLARLGDGFFLYAAAGFFRGDRYGAQAGLKKFLLSGSLVLDARCGYSGYSLMDKGRIKYADPDALTFSASTTYFMRPLQLFLSLGAHRFIYKDYGLKFQVYRFFHDFQFGLWSVVANDEFNGGFQFSLPLPPKRYRPRNRMRVRMASYFNWSYQAKRNTINGSRLRANELTDEMFIRYNPRYIDSKLTFFSRRIK